MPPPTPTALGRSAGAVSRRHVLGGMAGTAALTLLGCGGDAGRAQLSAARPLLRAHAQLLATNYSMASASALAVPIGDVPSAVGDLAAQLDTRFATGTPLDTISAVAPRADLASGPPPAPTDAASAAADGDEAAAVSLVDATELDRLRPLAPSGLVRSLAVIGGRGDELDGIAGHRIALDTADMDADALAWWTPRLHEKYRQANATVAWQLLRGDRELTRSGRYVIDITGTWTIADTTQNTDERLVEVDWSPSRSGARRSSLTVRQGLRGADGLAAWNERFTTGVEYEHDELWGA